MRFDEDVHDCIRDLLLLNNKNKKLAVVRKAKLELKKKVDDLDKCRHCDEGEPAYCENCFQDLISQNVKLQLELNDYKFGNNYNINNPFAADKFPKILTNDFYDKNSQFAEQCNEIKEVLKDGDNE